MMRTYRVVVESDGTIRKFNEHGYEITNTQQETKRYAEMIVDHFKKHRVKYTTAIMALTIATFPSVGFAADPSASDIGGKGLIVLLQKASFWLGMGVTIWGIVEAMLDLPGWKGRITKGIAGYVGILLVPLIFFELERHLMFSVWNSIEGGNR